MKWFSDDYKKGGRVEMKLVIESMHRYKLYHPYPKNRWRPSVDLYETKNELILLVDVAGMGAEDVEINVGRERVHLQGNRCNPADHEVIRIHHMEIDFGPYEQTIALPKPVDASGATSTYRDGFLLIRVPKEPKKVSLNPR